MNHAPGQSGVDEYLPGMDVDNLDKVISGLRARFRQVDAEANPIQVYGGIGFALKDG